MPKVSVVMSVYNSELFIKESIDSILDQTFKDFEFIIVDDGSNDDTKKIIENYLDKRIVFISNKVNRGSVPCLRDAIEKASSEYIAIQDGDDISMSDRIDSQVQFFEENKNIFCLGGYAIKIDKVGNVIGDWRFTPKNHEDIIDMLVKNKKCPIINPTSMFKLDDYKEIGGYSTDLSFVAAYDLDLWTKAVLHRKKFANIEKFLVKYRVHPESMTQRLKNEQLLAYFRIMSGFIRRYNDGTRA